jgi:sulfite reductase alpha subunit
MMKKYNTPLIDELEKGPWPSFVTEMKKAAKNNEMANDAVGHLEKCYSTKIGYWKHGGIVGVLGYGGGVIGRYSEIGNEFPGVAHFHTVRLKPCFHEQGAEEICDIWEKYGSLTTGC